MVLENNHANLLGTVVETPVLSHTILGEDFFLTMLELQRMSGTVDVAPVLFSCRTYHPNNVHCGDILSVDGRVGTYNIHGTDHNHLIVQVIAETIEQAEVTYPSDKNNCIELDGYICKTPNLRVTPLGRSITDMHIAVNRRYGKSDYIPCIAWGKNATYAGRFVVGDRIHIKGRFQSRNYKKRFADGTEEMRTAYEISVASIQIVNEE